MGNEHQDAVAIRLELQKIPEPLYAAAITIANKLYEVFKEPIMVHDVIRDNIDIEDVPGKEKIRYILAVQSMKDPSEALRLLETFLETFWYETEDQENYQGLDVTVDFLA